MLEQEDLPLALRRPRRSGVGSRSSSSNRALHLDRPTEPQTPHRLPQTPSRESKKRVRFSDSGSTGEAVPKSDSVSSSSSSSSSSPASTGLTPFIGQVTFLPMRQVLDGRVKRRIRRNGLSEEMNVISAEKRRKVLQDKAEMDSLRAALATKDAEIRRLSGVTVVEEGESIDDLKRQVEHLRRALKSPAPSNSDLSDSTQVDWSSAMTGGGHYSSSGGDDADHFFDESSIAQLACSTPTRRRADIRNSIPTPPSTSPIMRLIMPPMRQLFTPPSSHKSVQVQMPDEAGREAAQEELASLQLEVKKLTSILETYEAMTCRLADKLAPFSPEDGSAAEAILGSRSPTIKVEARLNQLLRAFRDRTAALAKVDTSLDSLGIRGSDAPQAIASLAAAFRSARLELEYLEPGESTLPLSASGAAVLDLLLARLRELARERLEHADTIDEFQAVEVSLRRQLGARVGAMDDMRQEISTLKGKVKLRNVRIQELEAGMDRLRGSVKSYTRDIADLETLAQRLEGDLDAANKSLQEAEELREAHEEEHGEALAEKDSTISVLERKLGLVLEQTAGLREELANLQRQHDELQARHEGERGSVDQRKGSGLEGMDTEVFTLRTEVDKANKALQKAQATVHQLRIENKEIK
ncbi:hypothetical protein M406DRAFT_293038 [Cryphonectria parasitica EP155]|uniref:Uncharacterized protein n=1 Tax=Cryphonectria parasitica (strain ATCC 38755 / EP155) TaxID=660469 RepID=A0A9P5CLS2_CRYP1|nr:uncharacterized protein M406DRAFT_293038 [Cryphonectria parasitica EP155]KAF3763383.1 hypothetical protein M406DRAFT_293038 [Cryphonectria parasitica EP155]